MQTTRLTYRIEEAAALLGISRALAYDAAHRGELPTIKVGRRVLIPKAQLDKMLAAGQPVKDEAARA